MAVATPAQGIAEKVSAMIEEQELTRDEVLGYLRQMMEIRALENQIAEFLGKAVLKGRLALVCRRRGRCRWRRWRAER